MNAIEILKAISIDCLEPTRFGIAEGSLVHQAGFFSYFGVGIKEPFPLDDEKQYFYYYGEQNEDFMCMPIKDALVFKRDKIDALYMWPID